MKPYLSLLLLLLPGVALAQPNNWVPTFVPPLTNTGSGSIAIATSGGFVLSGTNLIATGGPVIYGISGTGNITTSGTGTLSYLTITGAGNPVLYVTGASMLDNNNIHTNGLGSLAMTNTASTLEVFGSINSDLPDGIHTKFFTSGSGALTLTSSLTLNGSTSGSITLYSNSTASALTINSPVSFSLSQGTASSSGVGNVIYSQPFTGTAYKETLLFLNSSQGTTTVTWPTPYSQVPGVTGGTQATPTSNEYQVSGGTAWMGTSGGTLQLSTTAKGWVDVKGY